MICFCGFSLKTCRKENQFKLVSLLSQRKISKESFFKYSFVIFCVKPAWHISIASPSAWKATLEYSHSSPTSEMVFLFLIFFANQESFFLHTCRRFQPFQVFVEVLPPVFLRVTGAHVGHRVGEAWGVGGLRKWMEKSANVNENYRKRSRFSYI